MPPNDVEKWNGVETFSQHNLVVGKTEEIEIERGIGLIPDEVIPERIDELGEQQSHLITHLGANNRLVTIHEHLALSRDMVTLEFALMQLKVGQPGRQDDAEAIGQPLWVFRR